jgi:hypothetical protein
MHGPRRTMLALVAGTVVVLASPGVAGAGDGGRGGDGGHSGGGGSRVIASGLAGGSGSTIGPDGALYVTEPIDGEVSRVDRRTGHVKVVADCLPPRVVPGVGGAMDVAFLRKTMYVLVSVVGEDVGGDAVVGLYRVDGRDDCTVVADIGEWSTDNPPPPDIKIFVPSGVQYALQPYGRGFLVTDGHHNRVLKVTPNGRVREVLQLGNVVPTGLDRRHGKVVLALAGPVPHLPEDGQVVAFRPHRPDPRLIASGGRLLVDVEFGRRGLYALAQGVFPEGEPDGTPARPDTGRLLRVDDGGFDVVAKRLDRPTSMEIVRGKAYVVTYDGEVWRIDLSRHHR